MNVLHSLFFTITNAIITRPLWFVFRNGPCISRYVPMYCGMSNIEVCTRLVERVSELTWEKVPEDCEQLIEREFRGWYVLITFLLYIYVLMHVLRSLGAVCVQYLARPHLARQLVCFKEPCVPTT